jgi:hypothetical protein
MANGQGVRQLASEVLKPSPNRRAQVALPARRPKSRPYFSHISLTVSPIIWRAPPQQGQSRPSRRMHLIGRLQSITPRLNRRGVARHFQTNYRGGT